MTPLDEAAQAATLTARAAAGMCDAADMRRTMQQAQADIAQSTEAMVSDAALFSADQGDDFDAYMRQLCGDRPDGIIEQYSGATEGRWK